MKKPLLIVFILLSISTFGQGFLHRDGQNIIDGNGENIVLRGLGLGGWMVQEGYMLQTGAFAGPQHKIKQKITDVIGAKNTEEWTAARWAQRQVVPAEFWQTLKHHGLLPEELPTP